MHNLRRQDYKMGTTKKSQGKAKIWYELRETWNPGERFIVSGVEYAFYGETAGGMLAVTQLSQDRYKAVVITDARGTDVNNMQGTIFLSRDYERRDEFFDQMENWWNAQQGTREALAA
jgi:hypothetical protein